MKSTRPTRPTKPRAYRAAQEKYDGVDWSRRDADIARDLGLTRSAVGQARQARGLENPWVASWREIGAEIDALAGRAPDTEIARALGVHEATVRDRRRAQGREVFRPPPDWTKDPRLGVWSDKALAADLGLDQASVSRWRRKLGIPPVQPRVCAGIDWDAEPRLGVWPDTELARELGVSHYAVFSARRVRGIPPPPRRIREVP